MKRFIVAVFSLTIVLFLTPLAFAENTTTNSTTSAGTTPKDRMEQKRENLQNRKEDLKELFQKRQATWLQDKKEFQDKIQAEREAMHDKFKAARAEFQAKLKTLRDERKKLIVQRVDQKLAMINKNRTDRMMEALERLDDFLNKLTAKASVDEAAGKNVTSVKTAITAAQAAIARAKQAVTTQAGKDYVATITDDGTLRQTVGTAFSNLQKDLQETHGVVKEAREAVVNVAKELAKLHEPSTTVTTTP